MKEKEPEDYSLWSQEALASLATVLSKNNRTLHDFWHIGQYFLANLEKHRAEHGCGYVTGEESLRQMNKKARLAEVETTRGEAGDDR